MPTGASAQLLDESVLSLDQWEGLMELDEARLAG